MTTPLRARDRRRTRLIGRSEDLHELLDVVSQPPSLAVVEGEAGVGKSRLVLELLRRRELAGRRALIGYCAAVEEPFPLGAVVEALRGLSDLSALPGLTPVSGVLRPLVPELEPLLPAPLDPGDDQRARRHLVSRAVREVLAVAGPTVLVLEDLHRADGQTVEVLGDLVASPPGRLSVLVTYRREELPPDSPLPELIAHAPPSIRRLRRTLAPLDAAGVQEMIAAALDVEQVPPSFVRGVLESTGGLPFAVEELLGHLLERAPSLEEVIASSPRRFSEVPLALRDAVFDEAPVAVRDSVLARLRRLSTDARRLLEWASIPEPPVELPLLRRATGLTEERFRAAIDEAFRSGLLEEARPEAVQFRVAIARVAIHRALSPERHRALHLGIARALAALDLRGPAAVAYHFGEAQAERRWAEWAERAADQAVSAGDEAWAARTLDEVLSTAELPTETRIRLSVKFARAALYGLPNGEGVGIVRRTFHGEPLRASVRGELRLALAQLLMEGGDADAARSEVAVAVRELRSRRDLAAEAHALLASPWTPSGHVWEHRASEERAARLLEGVSDHDRRALVEGELIVARALRGDPRGVEALVALRSPRRGIAERREILRTQSNGALALIFLGRYEPAARALKEAAAAAEDPAHARLVPYIEADELLLDYLTGRWDRLGERAASLRDAPAAHARNPALYVLGMLAMSRGEAGRAEVVLEDLVPQAERNGAVPIATASLAAIAWMRLLRGHPGGGFEAAERAVGLARHKGIWVWAADALPALVDTAGHVGRLDEARSAIEEFDRGTEGLDAPLAEASLGTARAVLARHEEGPARAAPLFAAAAEAWDDLPRPMAAATTREVQGILLSSVSMARARPVLTGALEAYERLGAQWEADRVRRTLRGAGMTVPRPWRGGRRGYGDELSPREREVAALVGEGRTNREIAAALYLSPRTVGHHVSNAMRKLGVSSRAALAVTAARQDDGEK